LTGKWYVHPCTGDSGSPNTSNAPSHPVGFTKSTLRRPRRYPGLDASWEVKQSRGLSSPLLFGFNVRDVDERNGGNPLAVRKNQAS
jgi:hypothetical protein